VVEGTALEMRHAGNCPGAENRLADDMTTLLSYHQPKQSNCLLCDGLKRHRYMRVLIPACLVSKASIPSRGREIFPSGNILVTESLGIRTIQYGEVAEWSKAPHSKCGMRATVSRVRIPPSPQRTK
jgi:hypothetical protein